MSRLSFHKFLLIYHFLISSLVIFFISIKPPTVIQTASAATIKDLNIYPGLDTSQWQTYTSSVFGFTLKFPKEFRVSEQKYPSSAIMTLEKGVEVDPNAGPYTMGFDVLKGMIIHFETNNKLPQGNFDVSKVLLGGKEATLSIGRYNKTFPTFEGLPFISVPIDREIVHKNWLEIFYVDGLSTTPEEESNYRKEFYSIISTLNFN